MNKFLNLQEIARIENPSVLCSILQSLHLLILHGDILSKNSKDYLGFVIWCQEKLIVRKLVVFQVLFYFQLLLII
mgnify:CR=1 FL=1